MEGQAPSTSEDCGESHCRMSSALEYSQVTTAEEVEFAFGEGSGEVKGLPATFHAQMASSTTDHFCHLTVDGRQGSGIVAMTTPTRKHEP